jgi:hypothetical protein
MPDLENSRRSMERATYTPIKVQRPIERIIGRAADKHSYFAGLAPTAAEAAEVARVLGGGRPPISDDDRKHLATLAAAATDPASAAGTSAPVAALPTFATIPPALFRRFGEALLEIRQRAVKDTLESHAGILSSYEAAMRKAAGGAGHAKAAIPRELTLDAGVVLPGMPGARVYRFEGAPEALPAPPPTRAGDAAARRSARSRADDDATGRTARAAAMLVRPPAEDPTPTPATTPLTLGTLMPWAVKEGFAAEHAARTLELAGRLSTEPGALTLWQYREAALALVSMTRDLNFAFDQRIQVEPVGLLHLERMSFIPAGIERGELTYSVPLSPGEEVNISHKEWSNTTEEFEQIVTDYLEAYSEEGVTEKTDLTQASTSQHEHSTGFTLGVTASGGWGPVSISTTLGYNVNDSASNSQQNSKTQSNELTRKASSRTKKEHKQSFKVASAAGTEDQAVRLIRNPFTDKATRVDYYQLVRKWRVDLYRYGLRMTYDLTIPEPGSDILSKIVELKSLTAALQEGFGSPNSTLPWARFDLTPYQVTRGSYLGLAAQYGVTVEPPPAEQIVVTRAFSRNWQNKDSADDSDYTTFDVDVPEGYEITGWASQWQWWYYSGNWHFDIRPDLNTWLGVGGRVTMSVGTRLVSAFDVQLKLWFGLQSAAYDAWRQRVWGALREAAQARYELNRTMLKERLAQLQEELGGQDALSLRQVEREEVMKHVLRWLFGPGFTFVPPGLPQNLYGPDQDVIDDATWGKVLSQGEVIKFLHQAIEWENMVFFLYPYFWSHTARWELKKYLDHPDFLHRSFLKSGSARVVMTIRPGFERDFVSFVETGGFEGLDSQHPYMTIAAETEAFAHTNYPGLPAGNPVENARPLLSPGQQKAWREMQGVIPLLEQFRTANGAYPTTAQGLAAVGGLGSVPAADPWGNAYRYKSPGAYTDFELWSAGADGQTGGDGDDADITSWAEVSLIGRWYEYTPTSALDISFNETLPTA